MSETSPVYQAQPRNESKIAAALNDTLISPNEADSNFEPANVVDGLYAIARAINNLAGAVDRLGLNNAATPMGAIEVLSMEVREGFRGLGSVVAEQGNDERRS